MDSPTAGYDCINGVGTVKLAPQYALSTKSFFTFSDQDQRNSLRTQLLLLAFNKLLSVFSIVAHATISGPVEGIQMHCAIALHV